MSNLHLNYESLSNVFEPVKKPQYTPSEHRSGIVHIGIGAFHKAHQAVFTDDVLNMHGGDWRITAVSLRRPDARDQLEKQNSLYTVVEKSDGETSPRIIGAVEKVLVCPEDPQQVINTIANTDIKIVSLTITEKGYCQKNGILDTSNVDIAHDLNNLSAPKSMPGLIVAACAARKQNNASGFTVLSCDNLPHNGKITQNVVMRFAEKVDAELASWIATHISFCSTMVDRIVPATTSADLDEVKNITGLTDDAAVICEPFRQWVIEDNFVAGRPQWEDAGALLVADVTPYEDMKLRLLNGSHSALAYLGFLSGFDFIHQAIANPHLLALTKKLMDEDVTPTLNVPSGFDLDAYKAIIRTRFANSQVPYKTTQVANDGSQKLPQRILAVADHLISGGKQPAVIPAIIAAWFQFLEGQDTHGEQHAVNDPLANTLCPLALKHKANGPKQVQELIAASQIFPEGLIANTEFINNIEHYLAKFHAKGVLTTLAELN